jgi:hypothetical protein
MSALEPVEACADRLANLGFALGPFADEGGRDTASMPPTSPRMSVRWLRMRGTRPPHQRHQGPAASVAIEHNLASGSIRDGMLVAQRVA